MLHGKLLMVVRLKLLSELLIVSIAFRTNKEAGAIFLKWKAVLKLVLWALLLLPLLLEILLLKQRLPECSRHLLLPLASIVLIILSTLYVHADYLFLHVKISLSLIGLPLFTILYLSPLLLLNEKLLDTDLLEGGLVFVGAFRDGKPCSQRYRRVHWFEEAPYGRPLKCWCRSRWNGLWWFQNFDVRRYFWH